MNAPVRVLIVDDSPSMRQLLTRIINSDPMLAVVGEAGDGFAAREQINLLNPDVLTLDIEMPRMDGLTLLEKLMLGRPMPVVMISSLTERGAEATLRALSLGAVDYVSKPRLDTATGTIAQAEEIIVKIKAASKVKVRGVKAHSPPALPAGIHFHAPHKVVAIGASTGGTEALKDLLGPLPADFPGVVLVQHMPEAFTRSFSERLNSACRMQVQEAQDGDRILPGRALLAPGGHQMQVVRHAGEYAVRVYRGERVNLHLPSVDVLFSSCARQLGRNAVGVLLTGMGADGAKGLLEMKQAHAFTVAQDEATCVVFGMPRAAIQLGAADQVLALGRIPAVLLNKLGGT